MNEQTKNRLTAVWLCAVVIGLLFLVGYGGDWLSTAMTGRLFQ